MTYATDEISIEAGAPVELYTFTRGGVVIGRYTSGEADVTVDGDTYSTYPGGLARGEISISGERGRAALRITVARDHPVASLIHLRPRTGVIGCTVQRYHRADASDVITIDVGRVLSARRTRVGTREIVVEPLSVSQRRIGLHRVCQPSCTWELYGFGCRLELDDWAHTTTIASISGNVLAVASVHSGWPYVGGIVAFAEGGIADYAFIEAVADDGKTFTLDLPLYGAEVGEPVTIYPGCDWTMQTCNEVFGNSDNYGGRLNVPNLNPVTSNAFQ